MINTAISVESKKSNIVYGFIASFPNNPIAPKTPIVPYIDAAIEYDNAKSLVLLSLFSLFFINYPIVLCTINANAN